MEKKEIKNIDDIQEQKISVELTQEQIDILKNIEEEREKIAKEREDMDKRLKEISDKELANESKKTAKELKNTQKMVSIIIPVSELNPHDTIVPVCINGYLWQIKRGEEVMVPEEVKNILREAKYI